MQRKQKHKKINKYNVCLINKPKSIKTYKLDGVVPMVTDTPRAKFTPLLTLPPCNVLPYIAETSEPMMGFHKSVGFWILTMRVTFDNVSN